MMPSRTLQARSRMIHDGHSRLGGINVGRFPDHHFAHDLRTTPPEAWPLRLVFAGDDEWARGCYRFRENSDTFAVEWVREGIFAFRQNRAEYTVRPGQVFFVRRGASNETGCFASRRALKTVISLEGGLLEPLLAGLHLDRVDVLTPSDPGRLEELYRRAFDILRDNHPERLERGALLAYEFLMTLSRDSRTPAWPEKLRQILQYMELRLDQPLSVGALASAFGLSPTTLHRLFQRHLEVTPVRYLVAKRIEVAKQMLLLTETPIKEIAAQVGYANVFYFSTSFTRHVGESPRHYRLRARSSSSP